MNFFFHAFRNQQFVKRLFYFCLISIANISLVLYGIKEIIFCDHSVQNNSADFSELLNSSCYSTNEEILNISSEEKQLHPSLEQNSTTISREFFQYLASQLYNTPFPGIENYIQYVVAQALLNPLNSAKLLQSDHYNFGIPSVQSKKFNYPLQIQPCLQTTTSIPSLFVAIISAPNNYENRNIIRQTWLRNLKGQLDLGLLSLTGVGFIVGLTANQYIQKRIETESKLHGDILQINIFDYYYNLTLKVVGLLDWLDVHCSRVNFVLKVDDDVYVNIKNLLTVLKTLNPLESSVYGSAADSVPLRDAGKNYISFESWPWSWYPPFIRGGALLIPGYTIKPLIAASQTIPYFPFDDVYLTGLCTSKARIKVRFNSRFFLGVKTIYTEIPNPCFVHTSVTWLTNSLDHLNKSHWATNDFYSNVKKCISKSIEGNSKIVNSTEIFNFPFTNWDSFSESLHWVETTIDS